MQEGRLDGEMMGEDLSHWIDGHRPAWCVGCALDTLVMSNLCCLLCRPQGIGQDKMKATAPVCGVPFSSRWFSLEDMFLYIILDI